jgi:SAM-dependent methyltransferase
MPSRLGRIYHAAYAVLSGRAPQVRPWHFQWLGQRDLTADLREILPTLRGRLLDVGCGEKPYGRWLPGVREHLGIDVYPGPRVDHVIAPHEAWPFPDASFDAVLCTQVLEHAVDPGHALEEIRRVVKPGGDVIVTVPFIYGEHGLPFDFRRFAASELTRLFEDGYEIVEVRRQGAIGSTLGTLFLHWLDEATFRSRFARLLKPPLLPLFIVLSGAINLVCRLGDRLDGTGEFYGNVLLHARRESAPV